MTFSKNATHLGKSGNLGNSRSFQIIENLMKTWEDSGLPHTQGIQGNSGNFQVEENLRKLKETQGISGNFDLFFNSGKFREVLIFF